MWYTTIPIDNAFCVQQTTENTTDGWCPNLIFEMESRMQEMVATLLDEKCLVSDVEDVEDDVGGVGGVGDVDNDVDNDVDDDVDNDVDDVDDVGDVDNDVDDVDNDVDDVVDGETGLDDVDGVDDMDEYNHAIRRHVLGSTPPGFDTQAPFDEKRNLHKRRSSRKTKYREDTKRTTPHNNYRSPQKISMQRHAALTMARSHPKYKTEKCMNYDPTTKTCRYGWKCVFRHPEDECIVGVDNTVSH
jgi:hypothetical protein